MSSLKSVGLVWWLKRIKQKREGKKIFLGFFCFFFDGSSSLFAQCSPAIPCSFVSRYPFSPLKGNCRQRLQLVRQLDSCFVLHSSSHANAGSSLPISHLPFTCSFLLFLFSIYPRPIWDCFVFGSTSLADVGSMVFLQCTKIIHSSFFWLVVHFLIIGSPSSSSLLSLHLFQPPTASSSITGGPVWQMHAHTQARHTPQPHTCTRSCLSSYLCEDIHPFFHSFIQPQPNLHLNPDKTHFILSLRTQTFNLIYI